MAKLPSLNRREVDGLLKKFTAEQRRDGALIVGRSRSGKPFALHLGHDGGMRPDILAKALGYLDVSREEFEAWRKA
ncbi:MAG: hypothetical protein M3P18_11675 [Actinomycetota bacterium]|nr:hypothetical protein [Actinomycetota bacterium]